MHKLSQGYVQDMVLVPFNEPKMADTIFRLRFGMYSKVLDSETVPIDREKIISYLLQSLILGQLQTLKWSSAGDSVSLLTCIPTV